MKKTMAGYAPGYSLKKCITCGKTFLGNKKACQCFDCAAESLQYEADSDIRLLRKEITAHKMKISVAHGEISLLQMKLKEVEKQRDWWELAAQKESQKETSVKRSGQNVLAESVKNCLADLRQDISIGESLSFDDLTAINMLLLISVHNLLGGEQEWPEATGGKND